MVPAEGGDEALPASLPQAQRTEPGTARGTNQFGTGVSGTFPGEQQIPSTELEGRRPLDRFPLPAGSSCSFARSPFPTSLAPLMKGEVEKQGVFHWRQPEVPREVAGLMCGTPT